MSMKHYQVYVCLADTMEVEAENEEEAFLIASDALMQGGGWDYSVTCLDEEDEEGESCYDDEYFNDNDDEE